MKTGYECASKRRFGNDAGSSKETRNEMFVLGAEVPRGASKKLKIFF